jgi:expansin (peptidoglycan-binding protein)
MIAAINDAQYAGSITCGTCLAVSGPSGKVVVKVIDRCPECLPGDLDLSEAAFAEIADPAQGRVKISWNEIPCDTPAPVQYHFKSGSNPWWVAIQVRNHRHRIDTLEILTPDNQYQLIPRKSYNYFVAEKGVGAGPLTLRITDIYKNTIQDSSIPVLGNTVINSHKQFPVCDIQG